jgi:hypothetical protein
MSSPLALAFATGDMQRIVVARADPACVGPTTD